MKKNSTSGKIYGFISKNIATILLAMIIVLAVIFRFYQLNTLPPGLHPDEAANGLDIFRILENQDIRVIYNTNGPRESLFFFFQAFFVKILGNTILALRMAPAIFGVLAVVFVYLYTKDWFGRRTALLASFIMAVNPWVVTISRDGFRASMVPLMIALVAFFAGRAYKTQKTWYFVAASAAFALGFYTYTAFFMFGLVVLGGILYLLLLRRKWVISNIKQILISIGVFLILIAPLGFTIITQPGDSAARAGGTSFLNPSLNGGNPAMTLLESTGKTLMQYSYYGDENSRHNLPGIPYLNTFISIMLLLGLLVCFSRFKRVKYAAVIGMFFAMMLPAILTAEGLPHGLRSIGTAASVFTIAAVGINYLLVRWYKTFPLNSLARNVGAVTVIFLLFLTGVIGYRQYFVAWAQDPMTYEAYNENMVQIGYILNTNNSQNKFLIAGGYESLPTEYITHNRSKYELLDVKKLQSQPLLDQPAFYIFPESSSSKEIIDILQAKYPSGQFTPHYSGFNDKLLYYTFQTNQTNGQ
ncbi:MAG: hypothetical protein QG675_138 [Patescibacteria group bacterium]|jgi:4-amino-4-deoxy-L-arabinose transferase-like glycosyltransferase|nr:hypothetical protein [Patescibacteria group bacterium]